MAPKMLDGSLLSLLTGKYGAAVEVQETAHGPIIIVAADKLLEVLSFVKSDNSFALDMLCNLTAAEYPEYYEAVYHFYSYNLKHNATFKARCPKERPEVPSVAALWPSADFQEREAYDLLGVIFTGHPNLKRIMLPDDFDGHPLRKDYQLPSQQAR
jgi:NADH-quinone oxidoreductase subunit C